MRVECLPIVLMFRLLSTRHFKSFHVEHTVPRHMCYTQPPYYNYEAVQQPADGSGFPPGSAPVTPIVMLTTVM